MVDRINQSDILIRKARPGEGPTLAAIRAASITQLCHADHQGNDDTVRRWIGTGASDRFERLIGEPAATVLVADHGRFAAGFGALSADRITLNYVLPDWRFRGVSAALLAALEQCLRTQGVRTARLESTATALAFYQARGWMPSGPGTRDLGYPMVKRLEG